MIVIYVFMYYLNGGFCEVIGRYDNVFGVIWFVLWEDRDGVFG